MGVPSAVDERWMRSSQGFSRVHAHVGRGGLGEPDSADKRGRGDQPVAEMLEKHQQGAAPIEGLEFAVQKGTRKNVD